MKHISHYKQSQYNGSWWVIFTNDRPRRLYGINPPKRSKFPIIPAATSNWPVFK